MSNKKPLLYTSMSPALLHLYNASQAIVVIIDVLRATSTIATALFNGARYIVPVDSVAKCIELGRQINCVTAGERDGKIMGILHLNTASLLSMEKFWFSQLQTEPVCSIWRWIKEHAKSLPDHL
jgi:2-phosphosulpholactate phosphatase